MTQQAVTLEGLVDIGQIEREIAQRFRRKGDQFVRNADERYELEKRIWTSKHPEATPAEYSRAMLEIARRCGV